MLLCGTCIVEVSESEPESKVQGPLLAAYVTLKWFAVSHLSCLLSYSNLVRSPFGRRSDFVHRLYSIFTAVVYSSESRTALQLPSKRVFNKACKVAMTSEGSLSSRLKNSLRLGVVLASRV